MPQQAPPFFPSSPRWHFWETHWLLCISARWLSEGKVLKVLVSSLHMYKHKQAPNWRLKVLLLIWLTDLAFPKILCILEHSTWATNNAHNGRLKDSWWGTTICSWPVLQADFCVRMGRLILQDSYCSPYPCQVTADTSEQRVTWVLSLPCNGRLMKGLSWFL